MFGCDIFNTLKYFQESLISWQWKQLKNMKDKSDHSIGRGKYELTQTKKYYVDYAFPKNETRNPC